ncbi:hypothetical protein FZZ93_05810 [Halomonas eurihalina]|uniref:Uncharacterized protein n=1 Tax=Halomonas eurihalina TaxID=42566 RepID=A0A5D9DBR9_HALER|nr:hypothetical protein [Halomonas eurihalina]MDR5859400.1 hypothetical protein [Halomonas eurihalina]TZG40560.1 hypothetical protein FZZ93_05810 [Halomonas eurihalina]
MQDDALKVRGQPVHTLFAKHKNDLDVMLACCDAIEANCRKHGCRVFPVPAYFERGAIRSRKLKDYETEVSILRRWVVLEDAYLSQAGKRPSGNTKLRERLKKAERIKGGCA